MAAPKKTRSKVGVIGLGIIGTRAAANLRSAGHQVYVWSRTPRAAPNFLGSVVEVADLCDVIELFVSDDRALQEVIRTVAAALRPRHVVLCHATVSPDATRHAAGIVESQGARYLDTPFTGSKAAAQNRQLVYYVGGAKSALEEVRPVLEATSKAILHVGGVGDAAVLKIATNMLTASTVQTLAEALALVRAAGIDGSKLVEALENNASRSGTSDLKLPAMIAANTEPNFSLKHMLKDVRFAQELADKYQLSLPLTDTTAEVFALGMQNDWGDKDFSVVAQLYPAPPPPSIIPKPAEPPAPVSEKPAAEPIKAPVPVPEDQLAELALPPRPNQAPKPASAEAPASEGKPSDQAAAEKPTTGPTPADKKDGPPGVEPMKKPEVSSVEALPPKTGEETQGEPATGEAPKKSAALSPDVPAPKTEETTRREKKSTFQFLRDFFKPVPSEPR